MVSSTSVSSLSCNVAIRILTKDAVISIPHDELMTGLVRSDLACNMSEGYEK